MRNNIDGATKIKVTDEYGQVMYDSPPGEALNVFIGGATQVQVVGAASGTLMYEVGLGAGLHPPTDRPPTEIPPPGGYVPPPPEGGSGGGATPPPINGGEIPWPPSGQVTFHVPMQAGQTVSYTMKWLSSVDLSKTGFVKIVEEPGSAVMHRHLKISNNGALKFDTTPYMDTGPSCELVNAPGTGHPGQVPFSYGDIVGIAVTNGENNTLQPSNMIVDIAVPL